eukprot:gnl/TRDRNA2_/TRDRNA2_133571_c1_seq2.p1 gnl/TRDRNA2_/TRDRNA2_133571_c1~~gnl/TRDRNA2_/TRDRNA2_133571_c1_seq2.p1  ORF type:complete len:769 (-),score=166.92 gnl/TRDRNA2_/TRDRNA2_133571_c1_seq2:105-2162(-)
MVLSEFFQGTPCPLSDEQIEGLFLAFRQMYSPNSVAYDEFFLALKEDPSPERRQYIRAAFRRLDVSSEGLVDVNTMVNAFNANRHPFVSDGSRDAQDVLLEFTETLQDLVSFRRGQRSYPTNLVAWEEFEDYYKFVSGCYETDALFCSILSKVWDIDKALDTHPNSKKEHSAPAAGVPAKSRAGLHHWQTNTLPVNSTYRHARATVDVEQILAKTRAHVAKKGLRATVEVVRNFFIMDDDVDDLLDIYEFRQACVQSGIPFAEDAESKIFEVYGDRKKLRMSVFMKAFLGTMSESRQAIVKKAWTSLGGDVNAETSTISPGMLKERFHPDAHPSVHKGSPKEALAIMNEFLDTFSILAHVMGGCQDGQVSLQDFMSYYEVVSATIESDPYFDLMMHRVWSLPLDQKVDSPQEATTLISPREVQVYERSPSPMAERKPAPFDGPSVYCTAPPEAQTHRRFKSKEAPAELKPELYVNCSPITKSSIVFNDAAHAGLETVILRLRENLAKRGLKGWRGLVQRFTQYDYRRNGSVMRLDWERIHKSLGLGLSPEERETLFRTLSINRKDGAMDYQTCVTLLKDNMSSSRMEQVLALFARLQDREEGVSVSRFRNSFRAADSPQCILAQMPADRVQEEFCDAADFFGGPSYFDEESFVGFFSMLSAIFEGDDEFRLMTSAAFGFQLDVAR